MAKPHIAVIGAGIQGAGVAQAAAAAGYKVTVLECAQVGGATSSNSSKLIHGGLRYLESLQLPLVRECLQERQLLLKLAPELVQLRQFHIPIYRQSSRVGWKINAGLALYWLLAGGGASARFGQIKPSQWQEFSGLRLDQLQSLHYYCDAQTDDLQLTRAVLQSAQQLGTELLQPAKVNAIEINPEGADVYFQLNGRPQQLRADAVVNCTGPWSNELLKSVSPPQAPLHIELIQGSHLLLPSTAIEHYYYLEAPSDHRAIFALPWHNELLLGTTETPYSGRPSDAHCLPSEEDYLLQSLSHYFPDLPKSQTVSKHFCGLRVLPHNPNKLAFNRHRDTLYQTDRPIKPRLLSVAGGKLTSYRVSALKVIEQLAPGLSATASIADTRKLRLTPAQ